MRRASRHIKRQDLSLPFADLPNVPAALPSLSLPGLPSLSLPPLIPTKPTSLTASITRSKDSASLTSSATSSAPTTSSTSSSISTSSSTSETTTTSSSSTTVAATVPAITASATSTFATTSDGQVHTFTTIISDTSPSATKNSVPAPNGFLQNKAASGAVFGILGFIGLIIILVIATFAMRRRRRNRLVEEAISFDPTTVGADHRHDGEKAYGSMGASRAPSIRSYDDRGYYGGSGGVPGVHYPNMPPVPQPVNNMQYVNRPAYAQQQVPSSTYPFA